MEWKTNKELVKSRIMSVLGKNDRIYARKCNIKQVNASDTNAFLLKNRIQGWCQSKINYGLYSDDVLVALMTFGKPRFNKKAEYELLRYAIAMNTNVIGGASKLLSHFKKVHIPNSIISYCDLRWNTGALYEQLGFIKTSISEPNCWYTYRHKTFESRMRYQKHKLSTILKVFDPSKTEWQNMQLNSYDRFWDCGNAVFMWVKTNGG